MALATFIAGAYTATYNSVSTGPSKDGYRLTMTNSQQLIEESDTYGGSLIEMIYRGGSMRIGFTALAYSSGVNCLWPYGATLYTLATASAPIGRLASDVALSFVMSATANTPAASTPASITATKAIIPAGFSTELLYDSRLREVPVQLQFIPTASGGTITWATAT